MDNVVYLPVLGPEGWVSGKKKLDRLMAHLYASDASQTFFFRDQVSSMAKVIKDNQGQLEKAKHEINQMLEGYFKKYFDKVEVNVYIRENNDMFKGELVLSARLQEVDGEVFQLHEILTKNGTVTRTFLDYQLEEPKP